MVKKVLFFSSLILGTVIFAATPTVTDVVAKQRYPWNGLVDIKCKVTGIEKSAPYKFYIEAVQPDEGITNKVAQFWVVQNGTKLSDFKVTANNDYHLIWDAKADLGAIRCPNMIVSVGVEDGREKVQLWEGGHYWATTNIGAEKPEDSGYYFWWGDTVGYRRENGKWVASDGSNSDFSFLVSNTPTYYKYIYELQSEGWITSDGVLAPEYDVANIHWGNGWRMPTYDELIALDNKCDWTWTTMNGVNGYIVKGRGTYASNSIFLPAAGCGDCTSLYGSGSGGSYFSSEPSSEGKLVWCLGFDSSSHGASSYWRYNRSYGQSVRPVSETINAAVEFAYSTDFLLNTEEKTLNLDIISYNSSWIGNDSSATVVITDNGAEIHRGRGEGDFEWQPTTVGKHTLAYTTYINDVSQSEVYQATVYSGLKYDVVEGKAVITEASIDFDSVIIPNEIDGYQVGEIADGVFDGCGSYKDVTMPGAL